MAFSSLVRSTVLLGSSTAVTTLVAILRVKALAMLVGPAGSGLLGVLSAVSGAGTALAAVGTDTSATRRLALARDNPAAICRLRWTLITIAAVHGLVVAAAVWLLREPIAAWALSSTDFAFDIGLTGVALFLALSAGLSITQLQGLGRVADIARINMLSAVIGTIAGLLAVVAWGLAGLIVLIIAQPAAAAVLAGWQTASIAGPGTARPTFAEIAGTWRHLVGEGGALMLSYVTLALVPLAIRAIVIAEIGIEAGGYYNAAWTMSVLYIGFLLNAMTVDYFPRLSGLVGDRKAATALINDQAQLALAIGGVGILLVLALAPVLVAMLYSPAFQPAAEIVEWLAIGNLLKLAGGPLAFLSLARGRSRQYAAIEAIWSAAQVALVWLLLPRFGLVATGIAFALSAALFLVLQTIVAGSTYGFRWRTGMLVQLAAFAVAAAVTLAAARHSLPLQAAVGLGLAATLGVRNLRLVLSRTGGDGPLMQRFRRAFAGLGWPLPA